ncbi:hypothetical protein ACQ4M3_08850 [Leptolyngbya sp. AN03gr2]|uniref:hypothetical protein n=1 Tax=unclassified Leptolyngbya TaxID=2650499 RepID=UPI003D315D3F
MSRLIIDPANSTNWRQLYQHKFVTQQIKPRERTIIPATVLPIQAESRILAAKTYSQFAKDTWRKGGTLTPLINCGMDGFQQTALGSYSLPCNGARLLIFPKFSTTYQLKFSCPWWFDEIELTLYEYMGAESNSTEDLIRELQTQVQLLV